MDKRKCGGCLEVLLVENFSWKNKSKNKLQHKCKLCHKKYIKCHYKDNKNDYIKRAIRDKKKEYDKDRLLLEELKKDGCKICGEKRLPTLDFHHLDPNKKDESISKLHSRKKILEESKKCVILCKNCHSIEHYLLRLGKSQLNMAG